MFSGSIPALVTPFRNGLVDKTAFAALVERQIAGGSAALVPVGTTGETSTLSTEEHKAVEAFQRRWRPEKIDGEVDGQVRAILFRLLLDRDQGRTR